MPDAIGLGVEVKLTGNSQRSGDVAINFLADGSPYLCRFVKITDVPYLLETWGTVFQGHSTPRGSGGDVGAASSTKVVHDRFGETADAKSADKPPYEEVNDVRTNYIDYDTLGRRHKPWRLACEESTQEYFVDMPNPGTQVALHSCHRFLEQGDPYRWFLEFCRERKSRRRIAAGMN